MNSCHHRPDAYASLLFELPPRLSYDGVQLVGDIRLLQFTEHDPSSPSFGATFYLDPAELVEGALVKLRAEKRVQFAANSSLVTRNLSAAADSSPISAVGNDAQGEPAIPGKAEATGSDGQVHETAAADLPISQSPAHPFSQCS